MRFKWLKKIFARGATRYNVAARGADSASARRIEAAMREELDRATADAFTAAAEAPEGFLREVRAEIDRLLETGASWSEAEATLRPLIERYRITPEA